MAKVPLALVPVPPKYEGGETQCTRALCRKSFSAHQQIVVLRFRRGGSCAFCSVECLNELTSNVALEDFAACELWTYFPTMGKGALFGVRRRTKRERARDRRLKKGFRRGR